MLVGWQNIILTFISLTQNFPMLTNFLLKGNFSLQKSHREFSWIGLDQIHEQNNELIKGCGGASDLLNKVDDLALIRWETCSPDIARVMLEFEDRFDRIDLLFDRYFEKSLKKGTRSDRGEGSQYLLQGNSTEMAESFLKTAKTRMNWTIVFEIARASPGWSDYDCNIQKHITKFPMLLLRIGQTIFGSSMWSWRTRPTSDHIDILENFMLQLNGSRHGTLDAARLDKFKKSTDNDLRQARKHYANIFIVFFIKLGICGDSV